MIRKIIHIDEEKCNGCGLCANACHEGAIDIIDGKAKLVREHFCDGFGDCLPNCPMGAITFEEREAPAYDEAAVQEAKKTVTVSAKPVLDSSTSQLRQWPCQIQLALVQNDFYDRCDLLIAADCTAYAYADMHRDFMRGRITLIGCPKLDDTDYTGKLTEILKENDIRSVTVVRMEVPCCGGLKRAVEKAVLRSGKSLSLHVSVISTEGRILQ